MNLSKQLAGICPECAAETILRVQFAPDGVAGVTVGWCPHHLMAAYLLCDGERLRQVLLFPAAARPLALDQASDWAETFALAALARQVDLVGIVARIQDGSSIATD